MFWGLRNLGGIYDFTFFITTCIRATSQGSSHVGPILDLRQNDVPHLEYHSIQFPYLQSAVHNVSAVEVFQAFQELPG